MSTRKHILKRAVCLSMLLACCAAKLQAQVTTNGGSGLDPNYADLASAITALNAATITSPVVITASLNETAPAGGYVITASGTSANTITINGGGTTITASAAHTAGNLNDAVFKIMGGDYITLQNMTIWENAANIATTAASNTMTEWGIALLYTTATDNAQFCTITGCTIDLSKAYQNSTAIYANATHAASTPTTAASATGTGGGNSGLSITSNIITDVNNGIIVVGPTAATDHNDGLTITGNTIYDYGTNGSFSAYPNVATGMVTGVFVKNVKNFTISNNEIASSNGGTTSGALRGIYVPAFSNTPTGTFAMAMNNNNISLWSATASSAITSLQIEGTTASATSTLDINNNNFHSTGHTVASSGTITFLSNGSPTMVTNINNNTFTNLSVNTTGSVTLISNSVTRAANSVCNVNNNSIVGSFNKTGAGGTVTGYTSNGTTPVSGVEINTGNNFSNFNLTGGTTVVLWQSTDGSTSAPFGPSKTITNNVFTNIVTGAGAVTVLSVAYSNSNTGVVNTVSGNTINNITGGAAITGFLSATANHNIFNNTFTSLTSTAASTVMGMSFTGGNLQNVYNNTITGLSSLGAITGISSTGGTTLNHYNNIISNLSSTGTSATIGIAITSGTTVAAYGNNISGLTGSGTGAVQGMTVSGGTTISAYNNNISSLSSTGAAAVHGMTISSGTTVSAYGNKIGNLQSNNAGGTCFGITLSGGTTTHIYNNRIGDLRAIATTSTSDAVRGINITSTSSSTTHNVSYNTVYMNAASSGANFSTSGIFHTTSATATTAALNLRNNIIVNASTPAGTGNAVAFRRSSTTLTNYGSVSNNNLLYGALIFADGTNTDATLAAYQTRVGTTRDAVSVSELPVFLSTNVTSSDFLKLDPSVPTMAESGGASIATITTDFEGDTRFAATGYTGSGFGTDMGADEISGTTTNPYMCSGTPSAGTATGWSSVVVTGFSDDMIANGVGLPPTSTTSAADGSSNYFLDATFQATASSAFQTFALPANGIIKSVANPGLNYHLASATGPNALRLAGVSAGTLTLTTPQSATAISLLAGAGNGPVAVDVTVTFTDASTQVFTAQSIPDWYNATPFAIKGIGRVNATGVQDGTAENPRLYDIVMNLATANFTKQIASITVNKTATGGTVHVFAADLATASQDAMCTNSVSTIKLANAATGNGLTIQWQQSATSGGNFTNVTGGSGANSTAYTTAAIAATTYYRALTTCLATGASSVSNEVAVNIIPALQVAVTPTATAVCMPGASPITLTATGGLTYSWSPTTALSSGVAATVTASPTATTLYTVTGYDVSGCSASATASITVNQNPTNVSASATPGTLCEGGQITLTGAGIAAGYSMTTNAGATFVDISSSGTSIPGTLSDDSEHNISIPSFTYNNVVYTTARVGMNGAIALGSTTGEVSTANAALPSTANSAGNMLLAPFWDDLDIQTNPTIKTQTVNDLFIIQFTNLTHNDFTTGGITFQVQLNLVNGQINFVYQDVIFGNTTQDKGASATVGIQWGTTTGGAAQYSFNTASLTDGQSITFTPNSTSYLWTGPNGYTSTSQNNVVTATLNSAGTYTLAVTNNVNGCTVTATSAVNSVSPTVTPSVSIAASANSVCDGTSITFTATPTNGGNAPTYQWMVNGNAVGNGGDTYTSSTLMNGDVVTVMMTTSETCYTSATATSNAITMEINALVTPTVTANASATTVCNGGTSTLTAVSAFGGTAPTYQWYKNGNAVTGATNFNYTASGINDGDQFHVEMTSNAGCATTTMATSNTVTINAYVSSATITASGPTTICSVGGSVTLTAGQGQSYLWSNGLQTQSINVTSGGTYSVTVTSGAGCVDVSAPVTITSKVMPSTAKIKLVGASTVCSPNEVAFVLDMPLGSTTGFGYQWNLGGSPIAGATDSVYSADATGAYTVTISGGSSCTKTSAAKTATIKATPVADFTVVGATSFCSGGTVTFTAASAGTGATYAWLKNGNTNAGSGATKAFSASGDYSLVVTLAGCKDTSNYSELVTVHPAAPLSKVAVVGGTTVCAPATVALMLDAAVSSMGSSFQWNLDGTPIPGANDSTYAADTTGMYTLTLTTPNGCIKTSSAKKATVKPLPVADFTAAGPTEFCFGGNVTLTAPSVPGVTYTWLKDGVNAGSGTAKAFKLSGVYTVVATLAGCKDTADYTETITVNPLPVAAVSTMDPATFCAGGSATLNATPTGNFHTYAWYKTNVLDASVITEDYVATQAGTYKVIVTDDKSCVSKMSTSSVVIKVNAIPVAGISAAGPTTFSMGGNVKLKATPTSGVTWQWNLDGQPIAGATGKEYIATAAGDYTVEVTKLGCTGTSSVITVTVVTVKEEPGTTSNPAGTEEASEIFELSAFPNPVSGILNVNVRGIEEVDATLHVMDMNGKLVAEQHIHEASATVDMTGYANGMYLIRYKDNQGRTGTIKVSKQ